MNLSFGRKLICYVAVCTVLLFGSLRATAQNDYFSQWPAGLSPPEIGSQLPHTSSRASAPAVGSVCSAAMIFPALSLVGKSKNLSLGVLAAIW